MTDLAIQTQIEIIKKQTKKALKSKKASMDFLIAAGIINAPTLKKSSKSKQK